jgi:hypothetical protein
MAGSDPKAKQRVGCREGVQQQRQEIKIPISERAQEAIQD